MTDSPRLDASRLLGFDRDGAPLHELVIPAGADAAPTDARGSVRAQGTPKPGGFIKAQGALKPLGSTKAQGIGGKVTGPGAGALLVAAKIGGKTEVTAAGITKADGQVKTGRA
jgi:hypothetical protein